MYASDCFHTSTTEHYLYICIYMYVYIQYIHISPQYVNMHCGYISIYAYRYTLAPQYPSLLPTLPPIYIPRLHVVSKN